MKRTASEELVLAVLYDFKDQDPEDTATINSMVTEAKTAIDSHAKDALLQKNIRVDALFHSLIDFAINDRGKHYVAYAILAYKEVEDPCAFLVQLAEAWLAYLIYPVKASGNIKKGIPSTRQTPHIQETAQLIQSAERGNQKAFRSLLRLRQGDRCPITGAYGLDALGDLVPQEGSQSATIACHILPFSLNDFKEGSSKTFVTSGYSFLSHNIDLLLQNGAVVTWGMIGAWGSLDVEKLAEPKINGPSNGLLLRADIDPMFSNFKLWFEKTDEPDTYVLAKPEKLKTQYAGKVVTFVNEHSERIDLPDPQLLELHAAFSRVFHVSGAGECIEAYWRDMDEIRVLASNGSTNLDFLLMAPVTR
ncbi:hypothetical protein BJ322DRAFT_1211601 [Thelephora terrestris]|uniref:HNH nuclease domain-containing protein n=1 Tax=Thelephora terrestris TaxID=56493 RepID=A0A9P6HDR9_9AGAM|nr:hypothetical protein BJ322DRAFT_1211601 [Thelephora terrestris]